jgi:hypothetical protein
LLGPAAFVWHLVGLGVSPKDRAGRVSNHPMVQTLTGLVPPLQAPATLRGPEFKDGMAPDGSQGEDGP